MPTLRLYQQDVYVKRATATIVSIEYDTEADRTSLQLDQTLFFPEGGGQSCDLGNIRSAEHSFPVIDVQEKGPEVIHTLAGDASEWKPGDQVELELDWALRFDNMQRHCGEHIVSGAIHRLFGGTNKGFHMGEDHITIDIDFSESDDHDKMTWEMAEAAELEANRVIMENLPVRIDYFETREQAETYPLRKVLAFDEDISIVTIGDLFDPADCVACCGTHPSTTGQVGLIKFYKIEPNKGMTRIYLEAGKRALLRYQKEFNILYDLGNRMSSGTDDILKSYEAQEKKNDEMHQLLNRFRNKVLKAEAADILKAMEPGMICRFSDFTVDDLFNIGKALQGQIRGVIALVEEGSNTAILLSNGDSDAVHCGKLVKAHAATYDGKGGGRNDSARAFFPNREKLDAFLNDIL